MELVGYRFTVTILSVLLIILCMTVPFTNIEAEITIYDNTAKPAAYEIQLVRVQLFGSIAVACIALELAELFCAVSLLLR